VQTAAESVAIADYCCLALNCLYDTMPLPLMAQRYH
jgi:hypothetical protein